MTNNVLPDVLDVKVVSPIETSNRGSVAKGVIGTNRSGAHRPTGCGWVYSRPPVGPLTRNDP